MMGESSYGECRRNGDGFGDGDGGDGDGGGYGSFGDGDGGGYGDGYGDGGGGGYGGYSGVGDGCGDGYGIFGDGDDDGDGGCYGDGETLIAIYACHRARELEAQGCTLALYWTDQNGYPANGGAALDPAAPGVIHTVTGSLELCSPGALHATLRPNRWGGERLWLVALYPPVIGDKFKFGAQKREIISEIKEMRR